MAKLTTAQLTAVISTIANNIEIKNNQKKLEYEKILSKDKEYKKLVDKIEELKKLEEQEKEIVNKNRIISREIHDVIDSESYFYKSEYCYHRKEIILQKFINNKFKLKKANYETIRTEILVASIDPSFNIQQIIDKYSNI